MANLCRWSGKFDYWMWILWASGVEAIWVLTLDQLECRGRSTCWFLKPWRKDWILQQFKDFVRVERWACMACPSLLGRWIFKMLVCGFVCQFLDGSQQVIQLCPKWVSFKQIVNTVWTDSDFRIRRIWLSEYISFIKHYPRFCWVLRGWTNLLNDSSFCGWFFLPYVSRLVRFLRPIALQDDWWSFSNWLSQSSHSFFHWLSSIWPFIVIVDQVWFKVSGRGGRRKCLVSWWCALQFSWG